MQSHEHLAVGLKDRQITSSDRRITPGLSAFSTEKEMKEDVGADSGAVEMRVNVHQPQWPITDSNVADNRPYPTPINSDGKDLSPRYLEAAPIER